MFSSLPPVHILYENAAWLPPLLQGLHKEGFKTHLVQVNEGLLKSNEAPAEGIWLNRISVADIRLHINGRLTMMSWRPKSINAFGPLLKLAGSF